LIGAVVLAAGESKRMGKFKPLMEIDGKPLLQRVVESMINEIDKIVVVLGYNAEKLIPMVNKLGVKYIINRNYSEGMTSSFKTGLKELMDCDAVFLVLGDQPYVDPEFLRKAKEKWKSGANLISPVYKGKKGHPVLIDGSLFPEFLELKKNGQIRDVIKKHQGKHALIETGKWCIIDLDVPEDLAALEEVTAS